MFSGNSERGPHFVYYKLYEFQHRLKIRGTRQQCVVFFPALSRRSRYSFTTLVLYTSHTRIYLAQQWSTWAACLCLCCISRRFSYLFHPASSTSQVQFTFNVCMNLLRRIFALDDTPRHGPLKVKVSKWKIYRRHDHRHSGHQQQQFFVSLRSGQFTAKSSLRCCNDNWRNYPREQIHYVKRNR